MKNGEPYDEKNLAGTFVETAFTTNEIEKTIAEEIQLGIRDNPCAFLGDVTEKQ